MKILIAAGLLLSLAGCSSAASSGAAAQGSTTPTSTAVTSGAADTSTSAPGIAAPTSSPAVASTSDTAADTGATTSAAAGPHRPSDACTLLSSDEVSGAVGTPGPFNGAPEDPASDGSPVWGCTWGTHSSYVDIREMSAPDFNTPLDPAKDTVTPLSGIGDKAMMITRSPDGSEPEIRFTAGGGYYELSMVYDRRELSPQNADKEETAEKSLGKLLAAKLAS